MLPPLLPFDLATLSDDLTASCDRHLLPLDHENRRSFFVLIGLAVGLGALAVWLWRVTAVDSPSLMVLEQMSSRRYRDADDDERTALRASAIPLIADDAKIDDEVRSEE